MIDSMFARVKFSWSVLCDGAVVDNTPPSSSVRPFEGDDYWKELETIGSDSFTVKAGALDDVGVENVELWYRCSLDNWTDQVAWKKRDWQRSSSLSLVGALLYMFLKTFTSSERSPWCISSGGGRGTRL